MGPTERQSLKAQQRYHYHTHHYHHHHQEEIEHLNYEEQYMTRHHHCYYHQSRQLMAIQSFASLCILILFSVLLLSLSAAARNVQSKDFVELPTSETVPLAPFQNEVAKDNDDAVDNEVMVNTTLSPETGEKECVHSLLRPKGFWRRHFDFPYLKKFFSHWIPFTSPARVRMHFYLYKKQFAECGREIDLGNDESLRESDYNGRHPTRVIIHGWLSQSKGTFNRAVKNAYLSLTQSPMMETATMKVNTDNNGMNITRGSDEITTNPPHFEDVNVIVVDWSFVSSNVNYFSVVDLIEDLGFVLAEFLRYLHLRGGLHYDDVYLIGHSLGAQIAGSAGKQLAPFRVNTIYALDPAGPKFRERNEEYRLDASDANYVESIQTSSSLGFEEPLGHATFYPNFGRDQSKCYHYGCSHSRAHHYFAESITSTTGFWGIACERKADNVWTLIESRGQFRMGGEPSTPKTGTFYVKTNAQRPFAMGRSKEKQNSWHNHRENLVEDNAHNSY